MAEGEAKKLAVQNGRLLGHQNHSQKIQHVVKIKQENMQLKTEVIRLSIKSCLNRKQSVPLSCFRTWTLIGDNFIYQVSRLSEELLKSKRQLGRTEER